MLESVVRRVLETAGVDYTRFSLLELVRRDATGDGGVLLVFVDGAEEPSVFVKLGSAPGLRAGLETEFANLELLRRAGSVELRGAVPQPLFLGECDGFEVMAQTALPGTRMKDFSPATYFPSSRFALHFDAILSWLGEFRSCLTTSIGAPPDAQAEIEAFRRGFERSAALDRLLDESAAYLRCRELPPSPCHGDFNTANVLVARGEAIRVIDWELPLDGGWPLADLLYFVSSVWCVPHGKGAAIREANFRQAFFETTPLTDRLIEGIVRSARTLGLEREELLPLSVVVWAAYANRKRAALTPEGRLPDALAATHYPLLIVRDGHCRNLELLAELRERYRPYRA